MKTTLTCALSALALFSGVGAAEAADCQTRFLTGMWVEREQSGTDYCIVQFRRTGWVVQASCFDGATLKSEATWNGRFTATRNCRVTGNFDLIPLRGRRVSVVFSGTMNPRRGTMVGTMRVGSRPGTRVQFVQQWN